jgi:hypothetical protein
MNIEQETIDNRTALRARSKGDYGLWFALKDQTEEASLDMISGMVFEAVRKGNSPENYEFIKVYLRYWLECCNDVYDITTTSTTFAQKGEIVWAKTNSLFSLWDKLETGSKEPAMLKVWQPILSKVILQSLRCNLFAENQIETIWSSLLARHFDDAGDKSLFEDCIRDVMKDAPVPILAPLIKGLLKAQLWKDTYPISFKEKMMNFFFSILIRGRRYKSGNNDLLLAAIINSMLSADESALEILANFAVSLGNLSRERDELFERISVAGLNDIKKVACRCSTGDSIIINGELDWSGPKPQSKTEKLRVRKEKIDRIGNKVMQWRNDTNSTADVFLIAVDSSRTPDEKGEHTRVDFKARAAF